MHGCIKYVANAYEFVSVYAYVCWCIYLIIIKYHDRGLYIKYNLEEISQLVVVLVYY
jgi:hypothetical protein